MPVDETNQPRTIWEIRNARVARPLATCVVSAVASLVAACLWTSPLPKPHVPQAIVYEPLPAERDAHGSSDPTLRALRSPEHLSAVLRAIGAAPLGKFDAAAGDRMVERVRDRLRITTEAAPSGRQRVVTIRYVGGEPSLWPTLMVNFLADEYAGALRSNLEARAQGDLDSVRSDLAEARRDTDSARATLDSWVEAQLAAANVDHSDDQAGYDAAAQRDLEPLPGEDMKREFQQLLQRRETLLKRMTQEHPDVKALDLEVAECRHELEAILVQTDDAPAERRSPAEMSSPAEIHSPAEMHGPAEVPGLALAPAGERRSRTSERSVDRDAADVHGQSLRRAVADAELRQVELDAAEGRAVGNLIAARKTQIATIKPALAPEPAAVQAGWKNLIVVIAFGLLAALAVNGAWPASSPARKPSATVDNGAEFEAEFGLPVLGMISLGSI